MDAAPFADQIAYCRQRYFANGEFTHHFHQLLLRPNDYVAMVKSVLDNSNENPRDEVAVLFIIIFRFRNNLFHGMKWSYKLVGQLANFRIANETLMQGLERFGVL